MSCEVAELLFQAHANYSTWSIDFVLITERSYIELAFTGVLNIFADRLF